MRGFDEEKPAEMGLGDLSVGGAGGVPICGGLWGSILGFCVEKPPQMGLGDPNAEGFGGGSPFLGVFGGRFWGSVWRTPLKWGWGTQMLGVLGGGPHF